MNDGRLIFAQVMDLLDRKELDRSVQRYPMPRASRSFSARDQFLSMAFAQMTFRESLRDIEACLRDSRHLYAMGIRGNVTRTNLAYANENRDWRVYADLAQVLIRKARRLYAQDVALPEVEEIVYALDSSTIDLCLSMFAWADFRRTKAGIKLHTQIDLRGSIPVFISITDAKIHDVNVLDEMRSRLEAFMSWTAGTLIFSDSTGYIRGKRFSLSGQRATRGSMSGSPVLSTEQRD